jgi:hypothetical protein
MLPPVLPADSHTIAFARHFLLQILPGGALSEVFCCTISIGNYHQR